MNDIVGIDLGTTNSLIGVMETGFPILLADADGERLTPSVVCFDAAGEALVGRAAVRAELAAPDATIRSIKRQMGSRELVSIRGKRIAPEMISSLILGKLKLDAERALGHVITHAVITVPAYFNDGQRNATKKAAELAGFSVERIINEPTAAALAYGLDRLDTKSKIAVYDLGGGTFDVSILELSDGLFEVLATNGNTRLGGDDIDKSLMQLVASRIGGAALTSEQRVKLREAVVNAKHRLSSEEAASIGLPFFSDAQNVSVELTREELESVAGPIIERTRAHCLRVLADAKLEVGDIDEVILVGGVTRMPLVRKLVGEIFKREPNTSQNPDEAVALGATIQAGILSGAVQNVVLLDVTPLSLGIETFGGLMNVIIPRNSTIPTKAGEMFTTGVSNQRAMLIKVLQGEREMARDNWPLGEFSLEFAPAPKGIPRIGVQFEIDVNGILKVLARDTKTGVEKIMKLTSAIDVSDDAVEAMLADSLDNAFEDMSERVWTEAKLKAEETLLAVDSALAISYDTTVLERQEIDLRAGEVRTALSAHDVNALKVANAALDAATQSLAARVIEQITLAP